MQEIAHIIPVGYEFDRIVSPFLGENGLKTNRVYIISSIYDVQAPLDVLEKHQKYVNKVKTELESIDIKVILVPTNLINLLEVIQTITNIIAEEKSQGNLVYINMSGAGRLTSVASTLSGMAHNVTVYYVESDGYADDDPRMEQHGYTIVEEPKITYLKNFQIDIPEEAQLKTLAKIMTEGRMRTVDIIEYLGSEGFEEYADDYYDMKRNEKSAVMMRLQRNILNKLIEKGYIKKTKLGREKEYEVTETGKYVASISGLIK